MTKDKGADLADKMTTVFAEMNKLSAFMNKKVRPLLAKSESDLEAALKNVSVPGGGKGLKRTLKFIDDKVSFITNSIGD
jgi:hypothetical protein